MKYQSTRNDYLKVTATEAIVQGISKDGGLFVPCEIPKLSKEDFENLLEMSYPERTAFILSLFLEEFTYDELLEYAELAYSRFDGDPAPVLSVDEGVYIMELWHGPTAAFKDMALTIMPYLLTASKKKLNIKEKTLILVATSGDTGKAALEGFKDIDGVDILVFYPEDGVSEMQKLQMQTQEGENVFVGAIKGNFDNAQTAVKSIFANKEIIDNLKSKGYELSSANSINWGRLVPQIAYYISAYCDLVTGGEIELEDKINFCVPTGNFGNILAGYYAYKMGLPIGKLVCASNKNNVLTEFFDSGEYNADREFYKTLSPSMDILVSSNLERLLFELYDKDSNKIVELMKELKDNNKYNVDLELLEEKMNIFSAGYADEEDVIFTIANFYETFDYLLDPHTAVAVQVNNFYANEEDDFKNTIVVSTANPYKFASDVYYAVSKTKTKEPFKACKLLNSYTGEEIPLNIELLDKKEIRFNKSYEMDEIEIAVMNYVNEK